MRSLEEEPRTVPSARTWPLRISAPTLRENAPARAIRYTSATQGIFQYNNVLGSPMFAFSRHNYYIQEKIRSTRTPEEQHASSDRGNTDVRQYLYDVYVKSAGLRRFSSVSRLLNLEPSATNVLNDASR